MLYNNIIRLDSVDSTNNYLKDLSKYSFIPDGTVVIADKQTSGRGTHDRHFESPNGGLYLSYFHRINTSASQTCEITQWTAVSVLSAIEEYSNLRCSIKAVNDILINGLKVCGILTELSQDRLVIGIGINVNNDISDFPENIRTTVTTIKCSSGITYDIEKLAFVVIDKLNHQFEDWPDNKWRLDIYSKRLWN